MLLGKEKDILPPVPFQGFELFSAKLVFELHLKQGKI